MSSNYGTAREPIGSTGPQMGDALEGNSGKLVSFSCHPSYI
jgi:hypothetical protein